MVKVEKNRPNLDAPQKGENVVAVSKANQRAVNKYVKNNYDRINVTMPKGKKDTIQAHAAARGESVNSFINRAIDQTMAQETVGSPTITAEATGISLSSEVGKRAFAASAGLTEDTSREDGA